ncbi:hypothetical protein EUX98_g8062 [Antrodiella citrinella]|uniref:carboxypeptidase C n=1 Tax=Antrodiella citrinella TaxID=2447956 RepID=A0A4S4MDY1_9APHY|nr:hypothetical protein EUX98_g8062 [Antrodiella citrinella]
MLAGVLVSALSLLGLTTSAYSAQRHFQLQVASTSPYDKYDSTDAGLFSPVGDLNALSASEFTTLSHPAFPRHSVRVKKSHFCDGNVRVVSDNATVYNPHAWNSHANVFFIDQPVGVGYSYAEFGETVNTSQEGGKDIAAFVAIFFEHFSKLKGRIDTRSDTVSFRQGTYIPAFAAAIYDQNAKLVEKGLTPVNLSSIMLGNGCTQDSTMLPSYYDMQCLNGSVPPVTDIADGKFEETFCYPIFLQISTYLNTSYMRTTLGVDPAVGDYFFASWDVNTAFEESMDGAFPSQYYVAALLERGVRVLVYVGDVDLVCNWIGNERMTLGLEWTGQHEFTALPLRKWTVDGGAAGLTRSFGPLTFVTISDAGHMPHNFHAQSPACGHVLPHATAFSRSSLFFFDFALHAGPELFLPEDDEQPDPWLID